MKRFGFSLCATAVVLAGCGTTDAPMAVRTSAELYDATKRVAVNDINARVYGTFAIEFGSEGGYEVILSGEANFPGKPKGGPGWCDNGLWINSQGKRTAGSLDHPHPHCVRTGDGTEAVTVVLEPISVRHNIAGGSGNENIEFAATDADGLVSRVGGGGNPHTEAQGTIVAYAIDIATNKRVGLLTIDLSQYAHASLNYFDSDCTIDGESYARCLNKVILADYAPLAGPDGVGEATADVSGFLYWTPASEPFNYAY